MYRCTAAASTSKLLAPDSCSGAGATAAAAAAAVACSPAAAAALVSGRLQRTCWSLIDGAADGHSDPHLAAAPAANAARASSCSAPPSASGVPTPAPEPPLSGWHAGTRRCAGGRSGLATPNSPTELSTLQASANGSVHADADRLSLVACPTFSKRGPSSSLTLLLLPAGARPTAIPPAGLQVPARATLVAAGARATPAAHAGPQVCAWEASTPSGT
eukprot:362907-Chlamydomonas_euryale.AAC.7